MDRDNSLKFTVRAHAFANEHFAIATPVSSIIKSDCTACLVRCIAQGPEATLLQPASSDKPNDFKRIKLYEKEHTDRDYATAGRNEYVRP